MSAVSVSARSPFLDNKFGTGSAKVPMNCISPKQGIPDMSASSHGYSSMDTSVMRDIREGGVLTQVQSIESGTPSSLRSSEVKHTRKYTQRMTPRGCSRLYIFCVLRRILIDIFRLIRLNAAINMPFDEEMVKRWLRLAVSDCEHDYASLGESFGGTAFVKDDPTTYWNEPPQFYTWWKNNVERK